MILDIDIRVSSDNGVQVQQFTKHFDSRFEGTSGISTTDNSITKGFEEFLAEFLSSSGRVIRNNLITEETASSCTPNISRSSYSNVEYTLNLGNSQSITGNIPLDKLFRLSELSNLSNNLPTVTTSSSTPNASDVDSSSHLFLKRSNFKTPFTISEIDEMFQLFLTTAVNRYEDSFYVNDAIDSKFAKSS
ncbi:MAG: hypothetical protein ACERKZ_20130 [Lachnotalea sp.]